MSKYTWIITRDSRMGDTSDAVGTFGPSDAPYRAPFDTVIRRGEQFRLVEDERETHEVRYIGYILGEYTGVEPLREFGWENGCTAIEYDRDGRWMRVDGVRQRKKSA